MSVISLATRRLVATGQGPPPHLTLCVSLALGHLVPVASWPQAKGERLLKDVYEALRAGCALAPAPAVPWRGPASARRSRPCGSEPFDAQRSSATWAGPPRFLQNQESAP